MVHPDASTIQPEEAEPSHPACVLVFNSNDPSGAGGLSGDVTAIASKLDPRNYIEQLKEQASKATDHIIHLMVVFVLQTLLIPLFLLWAMYTALRGVLAGAFAL
mgnify:CR=1 FL=1